jgi:hypothetical protein
MILGRSAVAYFINAYPTISLCGEIVILVCERKWRKPMATPPIHSYDSISPNLIVGAKFMLICRDDLRQIGQHRREGKDFKLIEQLRGDVPNLPETGAILHG